MDDHVFSTVTGSPVFQDDVLYVPISAYEVVVASTSLYGCCSFRGSVVALDATTGKEIWRRYTINREAEVKKTRWFFVDTKGPSGAPVWQSPTVDATRGRLYFATGENFSDPATDTSDSVFAIDLDDGAKIWHRQFTEGDAWNSACGGDSPGANCPEANGPDYDFGAPPILTRTLTGKEILLAGQKSGMVYAMNPDTGHVLWQKRIGRGGKLGGIHWGMAVNEDLGLLYVPISDRNTGPPHDHKPDPGLHALRIEDGALQWSVAPPAKCDGREGCFEGISAAIIASTDLVITAGLDGGLHALSATTGESLWSYDAWRSFDAVNGIETNGGPFDVHGPMLADDMLFISSGYKSFGQKEGNAFLAFRLK
jgi:polyvinyl alcohol dehydrogenase (cytochrome)